MNNIKSKSIKSFIDIVGTFKNLIGSDLEYYLVYDIRPNGDVFN